MTTLQDIKHKLERSSRLNDLKRQLEVNCKIKFIQINCPCCDHFQELVVNLKTGEYSIRGNRHE